MWLHSERPLHMNTDIPSDEVPTPPLVLFVILLTFKHYHSYQQFYDPAL
jgi:hypothetical protein